MLTDGRGIQAARNAWQLVFHRVMALPKETREALYLAATRLLGEDFEARAQALSRHPNEAGHDPFGFDPEVGKYALAFSGLLYRYYFRVEATGTEHLPLGRTLLVSNHSGQIPTDGLLITTGLALDAEPPRLARSMVDRWTAMLPLISILFPRTGQVVGSPENARALLEHEETLLVFPEGIRGISKTFFQRYQLRSFGLGFARLALETRTPVVPVGVVGVEEQLISVANARFLARMVGLPSLPIIPQLLLGLAIPFPTKVRIAYGPPIHLEGHHDDEDRVIKRQVRRVEDEVKRLVRDGLARRKGIFW